MRAITQTRYGGPEVLEQSEVPAPTPGPKDVIVEVHASAVTYGDRRLRAADFPGISAAFGRLLVGVRAPRHPVPGTAFAGRVVAVGEKATRFVEGDAVFGSTDHGAYAERLRVSESSVLAHMPAGLGFDEAAAIPYGAVTALHFLGKLAAVERGEGVVVVGAAGGVGRYAVQFARHRGAEVTAVARDTDFEVLRGLGATHCIDHRETDFTRGDARYDVVFDTSGQVGFGQAARVLREGGRYLTVYLSLTTLVQMLSTSVFGAHRVHSGVALGSADEMESIRALVEAGALKATIGHRFAFERIVEAHRRAEEPGVRGDVVVMRGEIG